MRTIKYACRCSSVLLLIFLGSCLGNNAIPPQSKYLKKYEQFTFSNTIVTSSQEWYVPTQSNMHLKNFDSRKYASSDSIIFNANLRSQGMYETCLLELYNLTDDTPISGTFMSYSGLQVKSIRSINIRDYFPRKPIDVAIRIRSQYGASVYSGIAFIFVYEN